MELKLPLLYASILDFRPSRDILLDVETVDLLAYIEVAPKQAHFCPFRTTSVNKSIKYKSEDSKFFSFVLIFNL